MPIRVLHLISTMERGGAHVSLVRMLPYLEGTGVEFSFTSFPERPGEMDNEILALGGRLLHFPLRRRVLSYLRALRRTLRERKYDIIQEHDPELGAYLLALAGPIHAGAVILHAHMTRWPTTHEGCRGLLYRTIGRRFSHSLFTSGIAVGKAAAASVFGPGWQSNPKYSVIHSGTDLTPFQKQYDPVEVRRSLGIPTDALLLGSVARLAPSKNLSKLLEVSSHLAKARPDTAVLIVGDGPSRRELEQDAAALGVAQRTVFTGSRSDVARLLSAMDVFVAPSLYEGLPRAIVEAQAAGVPVVMADTVTPEVIVRPEGVAALDLDKPLEEWAATCLQMARRRHPGNRQGLEAVRKSDFNIEISTENFVKGYYAAMDGT